MADDTIHKQEFRIRELGTRQVILFPTRAQITRDIGEITLQPGANQITIVGLAPTVDEHSIKVEGTGSATITDVSVDLLPNRDHYDDIYPSDSDSDMSDDESEEEAENADVKAVDAKLNELGIQLLKEQEIINSAAKRLVICDNYGTNMEKKRPDDLEPLIKTYHDERNKIYQDHENATEAIVKIRVEEEKLQAERVRLQHLAYKAQKKAMKEKKKLRAKQARQKEEIEREKQRIRTEREKFWPKMVYCVTINLEPSSLPTPASSRRGSIGDASTVVNLATSDFHKAPTSPLDPGKISLSLSYITYSANWSPRYDLSLNTVKCNGVLEYAGEIKNGTSETWRDAKVTLSTSQASFSGLSESIPIMQPWHVRLLKGGRNESSALFSDHELAAKRQEWNQQVGQKSQQARGQLFGLSKSQAPDRHRKYKAAANEFNAMPNIHARSMAAFGSSAPQAAAVPQMSSTGGLFGNVRAHSSTAPYYESKDEEKEESDEDDMGYALFDEPNNPVHEQSLMFEEGAWEESGMTNTYELPATKTLAPSNSTFKHKIAKIDFKNIIFSHIVIGKLRQVAFLKARMRNNSKIPLLKGPLGLTLDGAFLGQATLPRCSTGESFTLPLGIDPLIEVVYPKPTVRRSQTGIFNREDSNVFTRTVSILNKRNNAPVDLLVLDQVPVSEEERLKIDILNPRGLKPGVEGIKTGQSIHSSVIPSSTALTTKGTAKDARSSVYGEGKEMVKDVKWGSAMASTKKNGEVSWNVKLNPGMGVKLALEYETAFPSGEAVFGVQGGN